MSGSQPRRKSTHGPEVQTLAPSGNVHTHCVVSLLQAEHRLLLPTHNIDVHHQLAGCAQFAAACLSSAKIEMWYYHMFCPARGVSNRRGSCCWEGCGTTSRYTRVRWFSHLDPLIQAKYACYTDYIGERLQMFLGYCRNFIALVLSSRYEPGSNLVLVTDWFGALAGRATPPFCHAHACTL